MSKKSSSGKASTMVLMILVPFIIIVVYISTIYDPYNLHVKTTKANTTQSCYVNFEQFKQGFKYYKWTLEDNGSITANDGQCVILNTDGSLIMFDDIGMILSGQIEYLKMKLFLSDQFRTITELANANSSTIEPTK